LLEPIVVPTAIIYPQACIQCHSQTGPFVDTHTERRIGPNDFERIYLCASCIRIDARALGFLEGDEHTKLLHAAEHESETQKLLARMTERRDKIAAENLNLKQKNAGLADDLVWHRQRVEQLERVISEDARSRLAVVGNDAA